MLNSKQKFNAYNAKSNKLLLINLSTKPLTSFNFYFLKFSISSLKKNLKKNN